jgi:AraC family transcriptional regulator
LKPDPTQRYRARMLAVLDHIEAHLDGELSVEELGAIAAFSKFHFHRQFQAVFGIGVNRYVQLSRLKRASYQLAFRNLSVIDAALSNGYESPESFARAFRRQFSQSPSAFRAQPDWSSWAMSPQPLTSLRQRHMDITSFEDVDIVHFPATKIALLEHRGSPLAIGDSIRRFIAWRKQHRLHPSVSATFNLLYEDPEAVPAEQFRFALAAATDLTVEDNEQGVTSSEIPSGRCARVRVLGSDAVLAESVRRLYSQWLPVSGEEPRDFPLFVQRLKFYPDVPEHQAISEVFLPIR